MIIYWNWYITFAVIGFCLTNVSSIFVDSADIVIDDLQVDLNGFFAIFSKRMELLRKRKRECICPGPIKYYEELGCRPIYETLNSCCPMRYDCDHWKNLGDDECLVNGHVYELNEWLRYEDRNPCDNCRCAGSKGWVCTDISCGGIRTYSFASNVTIAGCYVERTPTECCGLSPICMEKIEDIPICVVDEKTYRAGQFFIPSSDPEKQCYCGKGYIGHNVEPYCTTPKHTWCDHILRDVRSIRRNCVPTYDADHSMATDCPSRVFRCQNDKDIVINPKPKDLHSENPDMLCKFGNMAMKIGEELNENTEWSSACLKCICEVPPVPSCQRIPTKECNVRQHGGSRIGSPLNYNTHV